MKIGRSQLLEHLQGVYCGGLIPQAAFAGPFQTAAVSGSGTVMVVTDGIAGVDVLDEPVGIGASPSQFKRLISVLGVGEDAEVEIRVNNQRLMVGLGKTQAAFVTCAPEAVIGGLSPEQVQKVIAAVPLEGDGLVLDARAIQDTLAMHRVLSSDYAQFIFGPEHGGIRFGRGTEDQGLISFPGLRTDYQDNRLVSAEALSAVLGLLGMDARIWPGVAGSTVVVRSGAHTYYLSALKDE